MTALTVTATASGTSQPNGIALRVFVLTQAATRTAQTGATDSAYISVATSTWTRAIVTGQAGSRVYGVAGESRNTRATTAAALTTMIDSINDATNLIRYVTFKATSLTGTPGSTTLGFTVATNTAVGTWSMAEIKTAGTLTEDASGPAAVSATAALTISDGVV